MRTSFLAALLATAGLGCASEAPGTNDDDTVCADAAAHLAACYGEEAATPPTCDAAVASRVLDSECDALLAEDGKADGWYCAWNPYLWGCGGSDDEPETPSGNETLSGSVDFAYDSLGSAVGSVACALVVARDETGAEVGRTHTSFRGTFSMEVPEGEHTLTVYDRYGEAESNVAPLLGGEPAVVSDGDADILLAGYANGETPTIGLEIIDAEKTEDAVKRCADVRLSVVIEDECGGELAPYYDVRRDWVFVLEGDAIETRYATPLCQPADGDHWAWGGCGDLEDATEDVVLAGFSQVLPGDYTVRAFRVDLPDRANLDLEDELRWRSADEHPGSHSVSFDAAPANHSLDAGDFTVVDPRSGC